MHVEGRKVEFYDVWVEGYSATGNRGRAQFLGTMPGKSFEDACRRAVIAIGFEMSYYDPVANKYLGCRMFDNETDARKSYG